MFVKYITDMKELTQIHLVSNEIKLMPLFHQRIKPQLGLGRLILESL